MQNWGLSSGAQGVEMQAGQEVGEVSAVGTTARRPAEETINLLPWDRPSWQSTALSGGLQRGQSLWQAVSTRCAASLAVLMTPKPGIEGTSPFQASDRLKPAIPNTASCPNASYRDLQTCASMRCIRRPKHS